MRDVVFSVTTEVSSVPVRGNALAVSAEQDRRAEDAIIARVDAGDVCAWCTITVTAEFEGLSGVSVCGPFTTTERRFLKSADFREMKRGAFGALRAGVSERNAAALSWGRTFDRWHDESRALHLLDGSGAPRCGARYFASAGQISRASSDILCKRCERVALAGLTTHLPDPSNAGHCLCGEQVDSLTIRKSLGDVDCYYCRERATNG